MLAFQEVQIPDCGLTLGVCFRRGLYHQDRQPGPPADLCIAFHAGVWGYDSWIPTIEAACLERNTPFVITSYTQNESEGDEEAIEESGIEGVWEPTSLYVNL